MRLYAERTLIGDGDRIDDAAERLRQAARDAEALCVARRRRGTSCSARACATCAATSTSDLHERDRPASPTRSSGPGRRHRHHRRPGTTSTSSCTTASPTPSCTSTGCASSRSASSASASADQFRGVDRASSPTSTSPPRPTRCSTRASTGRRSPAPGLARRPRAAPTGVPDPAAPTCHRGPSGSASSPSFLHLDTAETLDRVAGDLQQRCQHRAVELHRSIVEVSTTLTMVRHLDPATVLQPPRGARGRPREAQSLDFQLAGTPPPSRPSER